MFWQSRLFRSWRTHIRHRAGLEARNSCVKHATRRHHWRQNAGRWQYAGFTQAKTSADSLPVCSPLHKRGRDRQEMHIDVPASTYADTISGLARAVSREDGESSALTCVARSSLSRQGATALHSPAATIEIPAMLQLASASLQASSPLPNLLTTFRISQV